jgi:uncharacterized protein
LKLHAQSNSNSNTVTGYGHDYVEINRVRHVESLILAGDGPIRSWAAGRFEALRAEDFAAVLALQPELILLGTGTRQRFPPAPLLRPLVERGVGFEIMDTPAACRTFNILIAEGRHVVAALLLAGAAIETENPT